MTSWQCQTSQYRHKGITLHKKWSFQLRISSINVTKSVVSCGFGHIYWRTLKWKTSFFCAVLKEENYIRYRYVCITPQQIQLKIFKWNGFFAIRNHFQIDIWRRSDKLTLFTKLDIKYHLNLTFINVKLFFLFVYNPQKIFTNILFACTNKFWTFTFSLYNHSCTKSQGI